MRSFDRKWASLKFGTRNCLYHSFQFLHFIFTCQIKYQPQKTVSFVVLIVESDQDLNFRLCIQTKVQFWSLLKNAPKIANILIFKVIFHSWKLVEVVWNRILFVRRKCSKVIEKKLLKFEAEGLEFANILRSLEQFVRTVNGIVWIKKNNNDKWLFHGYFWPFFRQLYDYLSQNWD